VNVTGAALVASITGPASGSVYAVGTPVTFSGAFGGDGAGRTHTAQWTFDSTNRPGTVNESAGTVTASYTFTTPGVYRVTLTVTNDLGATAASTQIDGIDELVV